MIHLHLFYLHGSCTHVYLRYLRPDTTMNDWNQHFTLGQHEVY